MNSDELMDVLKNTPIYKDERVFGYKILYCDTKRSPELYSPLYNVYWEKGELEADAPPDTKSKSINIYLSGLYHGIHFTKKYDSPALQEYIGHSIITSKMCFLVHCELSGDIVETEEGYRSQYARIERLCEVSSELYYPNNDPYDAERRLKYGNWKRYSEVYSETTKKWREDRYACPTYYRDR